MMREALSRDEKVILAKMLDQNREAILNEWQNKCQGQEMLAALDRASSVQVQGLMYDLINLIWNIFLMERGYASKNALYDRTEKLFEEINLFYQRHGNINNGSIIFLFLFRDTLLLFIQRVSNGDLSVYINVADALTLVIDHLTLIALVHDAPAGQSFVRQKNA